MFDPQARRPLRVALVGFGVVGRGVLRLAAGRSWLEVVGVIVRRSEQEGMPATKLVAEAPARLRLSADGKAVLDSTRPDVVLVATRSTLPEILPHLELAASTGAAVACTAEELGYIEPGDRPEAAAIFRLAEERRVAIVGLGLNPGFLLDVWPLMLASISSELTGIEATRIVDVSAYGPQVRASLGIGFSADEFERGLAEGRIGGHRGFPESLRLVGVSVGRPLDATRVETVPSFARRDRALADGILKAGKTAGVRQVATGSTAGRTWLRVEMIASAALDELDVTPIDRIHLSGSPELTATISPSAPSVEGTLGRIVNALPAVARLPPGVHTPLAIGVTPVRIDGRDQAPAGSSR